MFQDLKKNVKDISDEEEVREYLKKLLHKEAFDKRGLIYGMGHAIYSVSDPRAQVLKGFVETLAREKRPYERIQSLRDGRANGSGGYRRGAPYLQGCQRKRGFLQRFLFTACWICLLSCIHRFLQWHVLWAGAPTEWKN